MSFMVRLEPTRTTQIIKSKKHIVEPYRCLSETVVSQFTILTCACHARKRDSLIPSVYGNQLVKRGNSGSFVAGVLLVLILLMKQGISCSQTETAAC